MITTTEVTSATTEIPLTNGTSPTRKLVPLTLTIETGISIPSTRNRIAAQNPLRTDILAMIPSTLDKNGDIVGEPGSSTVVASAGERNKVVIAVKRYRDDCRVVSRQTEDGKIRLWLVNKTLAAVKTRAAGKSE